MVGSSSPAAWKSSLPIPYLVTGVLCSDFKITPGISRCSASYNVELIQVSRTLGFILFEAFSLEWVFPLLLYAINFYYSS